MRLSRTKISDNDTTQDPVELERKLMEYGEEGGSVSASAEPGSQWTLLRKLAVALSLALIVGYLLLWAQNVQETGGPEGYIRGNANRGPVDFISTLTGALVIRDGDGTRLYNLDVQLDAQNRIFAGYIPPLEANQILPYNHLPFEALLIAPFMDLPYPIVFALWTLLCGIAVGLSLGMLDGALPVARPVGWVLSMAACSYLPLIRGLMLGQNSPLVLLGLCSLYVALKRGQYGWAGAALVLVALKPQILPVVLLVLVLMRYWATLAVFAGIMLALTVLAMPILGVDWPVQYLQLLVGVAGWGNTGAIDPGIMHNWRGFLTNLLGNTNSLVTPLFAVLSLLSVGLLAWAWLRSDDGGRQPALRHEGADGEGIPSVVGRRSSVDDEGSEDRQADGLYRPHFDLLWALAGIVAMLTSLHLNPHDLTLLVFPAWIIGAYATSGLWSKGFSRLWILLLGVGYAIAPLTLTNTRQIVIPSVLLMALAVVLLTWRLVSSEATRDRLIVAPT